MKTDVLRTDWSQLEAPLPDIGQLLYSPWGFGYSVPGPDDGMSLAIGPLLLVGGAFGLRAASAGGRGGPDVRDRRRRRLARGILLASPFSAFVWERVPLLQFLQFPWRALVLPTIFLPLLAALALDAIPRRAAIAGIAAVVLLDLPHTEPKGYVRYDEEYYEPERIAANGIETTTSREYEPRSVGQGPPHATAPLASPAGIEILARDERTACRSYVVRLSRPGTVEASTFWFPGWRVEVDGRTAPTRVVPVRGTISFDVPSGSHRISLKFERTPVRSASLLVSLVSAAALLGCAIFARRRSRPHDRASA